MTDGTYWNGQRWVKMEDFVRPPPGKPKPPRKQPPKPEPKETTDVDK